jgi:hypothetical protein
MYEQRADVLICFEESNVVSLCTPLGLSLLRPSVGESGRAGSRFRRKRAPRKMRLAVLAAAASAVAPGAHGLKIAFLGDSGAETTGAVGPYNK